MATKPTSEQQDREKIRVLLADGTARPKSLIKTSVSGNGTRLIAVIDKMIAEGELVVDESVQGRAPSYRLGKRAVVVHEIEDHTLKQMLRDAYDAGRWALAGDTEAVFQVYNETKPKFLRSKVR